jgi:hypothetical protein
MIPIDEEHKSNLDFTPFYFDYILSRTIQELRSYSTNDGDGLSYTLSSPLGF